MVIKKGVLWDNISQGKIWVSFKIIIIRAIMLEMLLILLQLCGFASLLFIYFQEKWNKHILH